MYDTQERILEAVRPRLREYVEQITDPSPNAGENMYNCPLCGSGTGEHGTGAFSIHQDGEHWKCFACNSGGDILDLIGLYEEIGSFPAKVEKAAEIFGVVADFDGVAQGAPEKVQNGAGGNGAWKRSVEKTPYMKKSEIERNYTNKYREWASRIDESDYLTRRGISEETQRRFLIGYCPDWKPEKAPQAPGTPRIIVPTSECSFLARLTREPRNDTERKFSKQKQGKTHLFNQRALEESSYSGRPVFVVEGEIDALSVEEAGGLCVGLGSVSQARAFVEVAKQEKPACVIVALDNDKTGQSAGATLLQALRDAEIRAYPGNISGKWKDPNESLIQERENFVKRVRNFAADPERQGKEDYLNSVSAGRHIQDFLNGVVESAQTPAIPTGFSGLDMLLDGGLYEGFYAVGAISSLGKTTFVCQMADQIAYQGYDVLIFSLEMARSELMSKSISRHTLRNELQAGRGSANAKTARGITAGHRYKDYSQAERTVIQEAVRSYAEYADHIFILEGVGNIDAAKIRASVEAHIRVTGRRPVVVVDYLQIVAPADPRATDKQNTDKTVLELKRISRDFKIPVIGISSFNRENYNSPVSMAAFKESGAIEYSTDVLIGLQLKGSGTKNFDVDAAKAHNPREIELKILKNRNGKTGTSMVMNYYPMFNLFEESRQGAK